MAIFAPKLCLISEKKVLTEAEIKVLEKGLAFAPIQNKVKEPEFRSDFEEFCRRMRLKWYFCNDPTPDFCEKPSFTPKSSWKHPTGRSNLEVFLSELEKQIFKIVDRSWVIPFSQRRSGKLC